MFFYVDSCQTRRKTGEKGHKRPKINTRYGSAAAPAVLKGFMERKSILDYY